MTAADRWAQRSDAELVQAVVRPRRPADREAAFTAIWTRHLRAVLTYCAGQLGDLDACQDATAETFIAAWADLAADKPPDDSAKLRAWLYGIARHRCYRVRRKRDEVGPMPDYETEDEAAAYERTSRARRAEVDRLVDVVASTLTGPQRRVYELSYGQNLRGAELAQQLGVSAAQASRLSEENRELIEKGFGALILAREGRPYCSVLAGILDRAAWDGEHFTASLRVRITHHFGDCKVCDDCQICAQKRRQLAAPYAPALIPLLVAPDLFEHVMRDIHARNDNGESDDDHKDDHHGGLGTRPAQARSGSLRRGGVALAALLTLGGVGAAATAILPRTHEVPVNITVITEVAAVSDVPGHQVQCPAPQGLHTNCTKVLSVTKGRARQIKVVLPAGASFALRYFGCDGSSTAGSPTCTITPSEPRTICITTTDPRDKANVAECRRRTA